jgi:hypothetical protein
MDLTPHDSPELRSHGAVLRTAAADLERVIARIERSVEIPGYRGPAADRLRADMSERVRRLRHAARELNEVAELVVDAGRSAS